MNCVMKFRTAQPTQRLVVTVEKMDITDCAGDSLRIYDGTTLLNKDVKQQCGSPGVLTYTVCICLKLKSDVEVCLFRLRQHSYR